MDISNPLSYKTLFVKQWYNLYMGRDHFAQYKKANPEEYKAFSDSLWNGFVSVTKSIPIVNKFFSFTPDFPVSRQNQEPGSFSAEELEALNPRQIGRELGKVYKEASSDTKPL